VGDVCGIYYDINGRIVQHEFHQRRIGISPSNLKEVKIRLAIAGNVEKSEAIFGAISGGFINSLVTDDQTAIQILKLAREHKQVNL